jgi:hypothetical protein
VTPSSGASPQEFFADQPLGLAAFDRVVEMLAPVGTVEVRVSKSQVAFRRKRGFAYLWLPGRYLSRPGADVVLSIALGRHVESSRWKQVVEPAPGQWMHHLEITNVSDLDDDVSQWLREAADRAG